MVTVIDETDEDLRALIEADFGELPVGKQLSEHLLDWLTYRARRIPARPRNLIVSAEVSEVAHLYPGLDRLVRAIRAGDDLGPWLSNSVRHGKSNHRADMMFNDWKISHFHVGPIWTSPNTVKRSGMLLYAYVNSTIIVLLNICPHGQWSSQSLLEILDRNFPDGLHEVKGVTPYHLSDQERANLRANRVNSIIEVNGRVVMAPGMGIMSTGHSMRIQSYAMHLLRNIDYFRGAIPKGETTTELRTAIIGNLSIPVRLGVRLLDGGLTIIDKNRSLSLYSMICLE